MNLDHFQVTENEETWKAGKGTKAKDNAAIIIYSFTKSSKAAEPRFLSFVMIISDVILFPFLQNERAVLRAS